MDDVWDILDELVSKDIKLVIEDGKLSCYAPKSTLTQELATSIARFKPEIMGILSSGDVVARPATGGAGVGNEKEFPLSIGESSHYLLQNLNPERSHAVPICVNIDAAIDSGMLAKAWDCVIDRYPILKTRIVEKEGVPYHRLDEQCRSKIRQESLPFDSDEQVVAYLQEKILEPFDLRSGPLSRITLFTRKGGRFGLFILAHHIISDGFSCGVLLQALFAFYKDIARGAPTPLPRESSGYEAFVAWEQQMLASSEGRKHAEYWKAQLQGDLAGLKLLPDAPRPVPPDYKPEVLIDILPAGVGGWVRDFSKAHSIPHSAVFLAVFQLLLHKYTNQKDIVVVMPVIVRPEQRFVDEVGYFFNIVPVRANFEKQTVFADFMRNTQIRMLDAVFHAAYPFPMMVSRQKGEGGQEFKIYYAYHEFSNLSDTAFLSIRQEFGLSPVEGFCQRAEGDLDLALEVFSEGDTFRIHLQSNPNLYSNDTIRALLGHFRVLLSEIGKNPTLPIQHYPIATDDDRQRVLIEWNDTDADYPKDRCIHDFFLDQVVAGPDRPAVAYAEQALSYGELGEATRDLALYLQSLAIGPDAVVALCVERSIEMMTGIMGIVRAGGAYMPIDPDYPDDRVSYMLQDSETTVVLTQAKFKERMQSLAGERVRIVSLDDDWLDVRGAAAALAQRGIELDRTVESHNVAYVIYTSGSTGKPKGVLVEHRALVNRLNWMQKSYLLGETDVVLQKTPYCFDVSVWEFFWTPMTGASLVFAAPNGHSDAQYLEALINKAGITTLHYVPSMLHTFLDNAKGQCESVRLIFCSGEALDRNSVDRYRKTFPNAALHNLYGPTEAAIDVTFYDCTKIEYPFVPIGAPIDNTQIYIVDSENNPQPVGVPGELHIAGDNLARGYLNRPELTRERFIANPFRPGTRMYRTGDLARWLDDGNIQYLGRIDDQVKIGGVRIETGEIESHLNRHPAISESVVVARGPDGYKQLIAFYRPHASTQIDVASLAHKELRAHLLETLPEYMIPAAFVGVSAIPVTSNGKADRRALLQMDVGLESSQEYVAPRNEIERKLVEIWAHVFKEKGFVLEQAQIGVDDNFFELGGNSLLATQLLYRIRSTLGVDLPVRALFDQVTIGQLADLIASMGSGDMSDSNPHARPTGPEIVVAIQPRGDLTPVFALPGVGGNVLSFRELSNALGANQPFYALQAIGLDGIAPPPESVEDTARANIAAIREIQTHGPYRLLGHSYGGGVAYEMARQLLEQGEKVESLALLDAATPSALYADRPADEFEGLRQLCSELAEQGGKRFEVSAAELRQMPVEELLDILGRLGISVDREQYETLYRVFKANRLCYERYRPRALPQDIEVLLFRATQSQPEAESWPEDYGWGSVLKRAPQIHDVEADHHSMLRGRPALALARILSWTLPLSSLNLPL